MLQTDTKCLADLCGALHCDFVLSSKKPKSKCNPAAVAKNRHLCEVAFLGSLSIFLPFPLWIHDFLVFSFDAVLLVYSLSCLFRALPIVVSQ